MVQCYCNVYRYLFGEMSNTVNVLIFLETLMNNIRNDVISYKQFIKKNTQKQKNTLLKRLEQEKALNGNSELVFDIENALNVIK